MNFLLLKSIKGICSLLYPLLSEHTVKTIKKTDLVLVTEFNISEMFVVSKKLCQEVQITGPFVSLISFSNLDRAANSEFNL